MFFYDKLTFVCVLKIFLLLCSVLSGALFALVWHNYEQVVSCIMNLHSPINKLKIFQHWQSKLDSRLKNQPNYDKWLADQGYESVSINRELLSYSGKNYETETEFLFNKTRILCMVLTTSRALKKALKNTWTKHCNHAIFYGPYQDKKNISYVRIEPIDENFFSTKTFCLAFTDLISKYNQYDWLIITTDKTYAIIENLRHYVASADPMQTFYIGHPVQHYFLGVYNAHEAGIVLSRGTVNLIAKSLFTNHSSCSTIKSNNQVVWSGFFDAYIGMHLALYGVKPSNTLDERTMNGGSRFHLFRPEKHMNPQLIPVFDSYWTSHILPLTSGFHCCSDKAITFTGFSPVTMYFIEYLLYHLAAFTEVVDPLGLGNHPSIESYRVPSILIQSNERSRKSKSHHRNHVKRKHSRKHKKKQTNYF